MGDKFIALLDFAVRNLGELKGCNFFEDGSSSVDVLTKDGKLIHIYVSIKEDKTND